MQEENLIECVVSRADTTDPFLPMEVVSMPQRIKVVEFGTLIEIPCEL